MVSILPVVAYLPGIQPRLARTKQSLASSSLRSPADFSGPSGMVPFRYSAATHIFLLANCTLNGRWAYSKYFMIGFFLRIGAFLKLSSIWVHIVSKSSIGGFAMIVPFVGELIRGSIRLMWLVTYSIPDFRRGNTNYCVDAVYSCEAISTGIPPLSSGMGPI